MTPAELVASVFGPAMRDYPGYEHEVVVSVGGDAVAYVGLARRTIGLGGREVDVAGIGFVCTDPTYRHLGLMSAALRGAHRTAVLAGLPFALLNTGSPALYVPFGYRPAANLPGEWLVSCLGDAPWPDGEDCDLRGSW